MFILFRIEVLAPYQIGIDVWRTCSRTLALALALALAWLGLAWLGLRLGLGWVPASVRLYFYYTAPYQICIDVLRTCPLIHWLGLSWAWVALSLSDEFDN